MAINISNNGFSLFKDDYKNNKIRFQYEADDSKTTTIKFANEDDYNTSKQDYDNSFSYINSDIKEMTYSKEAGGNDFKFILEPVFEYLAPKLQQDYNFNSFLSMPTHLIRNVVGSEQGWGAGVGSSFTNFYSNVKEVVDNNYYFKNQVNAEDTYRLRLDFLNFATSEDLDGNGSNFNQNVSINENIFKNVIIFNKNVVEKRIHPQKVNITLEGNDLIKPFSSNNDSLTLKQKFFNNKQMYHFTHDFVKSYFQDMYNNFSLDSSYKSIELLSGNWDEQLDGYYSYNLLSEIIDDIDLNIIATDHLAVVQSDQYANDRGDQLRGRDREEAADILEESFHNCIKTAQKLIEYEAKTDCEILLHRVLKTNLDSGGEQNFWISTPDNSLSFIDTQVTLEEKYSYQLFSYVITYGVKYNNPVFDDSNFTVTYAIEPMVSIYEVSMGEPKEIKITQPPQPTPNIEFKNIKGSENKIKIIMNLNAHEEDGPFYPIESLEEKQTLDENYALMNPSSEASYFRYETQYGRYQIFRTNVKPKIGTNWGYENIKNVDNIIVESENNCTMVTYVDTIKPFQKYYYVIRSINHFGYYSQPSYLYEVEATQDADETFLHVQNVEFAEQVEKKQMMEKTMSKLFQIVPDIQQLTIPQTAISAIQSVSDPNQLPDLGDEDITKVWGKDFKIRLTSKSTGKKIDFNIKFNLNKIN